MIGYIEGKIIEKNLDSIIINAGGIGYIVYTTASLMQECQDKDEASVWTFLAVRENSMDLYGFRDKKELSVFKLLLTISGIGPKSALSILNSTNTETLISGIRKDDASYLSKMSGIGKKTAEKIIVNLKDKLGADEFTDGGSSGSNDHNVVAIDALVALGYSEKDSRDTVSKIKNIEDPESIIKEALKNMGRN